VVALLDDPRVVLELITDGVHVDPALWEHVLGVAGPERVAAVTDATAAAGMPDGRHRLGPLEVEVRGGVARVAGTSTLAGGTATSDVLFANLVGASKGPRASALRQVTATTPASVLGLTDVGRIEAGCRADLVLLDASSQVRAVFRAG
jgi:N-acetylglucosamine-6-phosphate deacetylase